MIQYKIGNYFLNIKDKGLHELQQIIVDFKQIHTILIYSEHSYKKPFKILIYTKCSMEQNVAAFKGEMTRIQASRFQNLIFKKLEEYKNFYSALPGNQEGEGAMEGGHEGAENSSPDP